MPRLRQAGAYVLLLHKRRGTPAPTLVTPPSANASQTIGVDPGYVAGTYDNADTVEFTRWEQSSDGSTWEDTRPDPIGAPDVYDMPLSNSAPTDNQFGKVLRVVETATGAGGVATAESAATGRVAETPVQTLGAEGVTNGDMSSATGWTVGAAWGIGSGVATATNNTSSTLSQSILTADEFYEVGETVVHTSGGFVSKKLGSSATMRTVAMSGQTLDIGWVQGPDARLQYFGGFSWNGTVDNVTAKKITRNAQLTPPSADMDIAQLYTLPASPVVGHQLRLLLRISDLVAGNFLEARIERVGAQWNVTLYTVASWARTAIATATNVGATNGIRVNANGDQLSLFTTANGGGSWTQRDTTKTSSLYQSATGVNVVHSSAFTAGLLTYAPA